MTSIADHLRNEARFADLEQKIDRLIGEMADLLRSQSAGKKKPVAAEHSAPQSGAAVVETTDATDAVEAEVIGK